MAPPKCRRSVTPMETRDQMVKAELDLFSSRMVQSAVQGHCWTDLRPISSVNQQSPITFKIPGHEDNFLDPIFYLKIKLKVKSHDGSPLPKGSTIAPVNCFGHALFKRVDMKLQDTLITTSTDNYAFRAYLERLLNFDGGAKQTHLATEVYYKDVAGAFDELDETLNTGYAERMALITESKPCTIIIRLATDLANQPKLIPNLVDIGLTLHQNSNAFRMMFSPQKELPMIEFQDVSLYVRHVKLSAPMATAIAETLRLKPACYPISHAVVKSFQISPGLTIVNRENLSMGLLPKTVVLGVLESDAYLGVGNKSPFNFKSKQPNFVCLYKDSKQIPSIAFTPNFKEGDVVREYLSLFQVSGKLHSTQDNDIRLHDYINDGYALYGFDLTSDECGFGCHANPIQQGTLSLKMQFEPKSIDQACTLLIYMLYDNYIYIDNNRNVVKDFS